MKTINQRENKSKAKVIGVDEPFKGLSNLEIDAVARYLDNIREKEKTLIVIDHTSGIKDYFSEWIVLKNQDGLLVGNIVDSKSPAVICQLENKK